MKRRWKEEGCILSFMSEREWEDRTHLFIIIRQPFLCKISCSGAEAFSRNARLPSCAKCSRGWTLPSRSSHHSRRVLWRHRQGGWKSDSGFVKSYFGSLWGGMTAIHIQPLHWARRPLAETHSTRPSPRFRAVQAVFEIDGMNVTEIILLITRRVRDLFLRPSSSAIRHLSGKNSAPGPPAVRLTVLGSEYKR